MEIKKEVIIVLNNISNAAGTEKAAIDLANMLAKSNRYLVKIISLYTKDGIKSYFELHESIKVVNLGFDLRKLVIWRMYDYIRIRERIKQECKNFGTIIIGTTHAINMLISLYDEKVLTIGCEHMIYSQCPIYSRIMRRFLYKRLNALVVLTKADADNYHFLNKEKVYVIPNMSKFSDIGDLKSKRLLYLGRLEKIKDVKSLVLCMNVLNNITDGWILDIYGDGSEKIQIVNLINKLKLSDKVLVHGVTKDVEKSIVNSSIVLMTSRSEALPMALIEAQSCGIPIVCFGCDYGPKEIVSDGNNGFLIENRNIIDMAEKISVLLNDYSLRKRFGKNALLAGKRYSESRVMDLWEKLFTDIAR